LNNKGFSLLEILIALIILAIGLLAIAAMQITSIRGNFFSDNMTQASVLAQDRLEGLRSLPFVNGNWPDALSMGDHDDGKIPVRGLNFSRSFRVDQDPNNPATGRRITVTIRWKDHSDHSISFSTIRSP